MRPNYKYGCSNRFCVISFIWIQYFFLLAYHFIRFYRNEHVDHSVHHFTSGSCILCQKQRIFPSETMILQWSFSAYLASYWRSLISTILFVKGGGLSYSIYILQVLRSLMFTDSYWKLGSFMYLIEWVRVKLLFNPSIFCGFGSTIE